MNAVQVLLHEWLYKPAGVLSYGGVSGGLRSAQVLRQLLSNVNVHALPRVVPVHFFQQFIDDGGFRPSEQIQDGVNGMLDELHKWARALRTIRAEQAAVSAPQRAPRPDRFQSELRAPLPMRTEGKDTSPTVIRSGGIASARSASRSLRKPRRTSVGTRKLWTTRRAQPGVSGVLGGLAQGGRLACGRHRQARSSSAVRHSLLCSNLVLTI